MLGEVSHIRKDEVHVKGYIRQNYLNTKRLVHITGMPVLSWQIKRIEIATDPTPLKLSVKDKEKVLSTAEFFYFRQYYMYFFYVFASFVEVFITVSNKTPTCKSN